MSVTRMVMVLVDGACAVAGAQVNAPVFSSMAAPVGAPGSRAGGRWHAPGRRRHSATTRMALVWEQWRGSRR